MTVPSKPARPAPRPAPAREGLTPPFARLGIAAVIAAAPYVKPGRATAGRRG